MTYYQTFPPDKFEDGDVLDGCNCARRTVDFNHKAVTVRDCNAFDMTPVNAENVIVEDSPSWGKASTPDDSEPVDPIERETEQLLSRLAEISADNPDMVAGKMAEQSDALLMQQASEIMAMKPAPIEKVGG